MTSSIVLSSVKAQEKKNWN